MNSKKKRICFYPILASGHVNISVSLGKIFLDHYSDQVEVYYLVDNVFKDKLTQCDSRFKFAVFEYDNKDGELGLVDLVEKLKKILDMSLIEKLKTQWTMFTQDKTLEEIDRKCELLLDQIKPDFVLADQCWQLPSLVKYNHSFIISANPLMFAFEGFPRLGDDSKLSEKEKIDKFRKDFEETRSRCAEHLLSRFKIRNLEYKKELLVDLPFSEHFAIYSYPHELNYYDEAMNKKHRLFRMDTPIYKNNIPKPFELPEDFKNIPASVCYLSLGSGFSIYVHLLQNLINALDKIPGFKFIVSKGLYGDNLKFPSSKFIGEAYVNQLAVLQAVDLAIIHGGNNSLSEAFYFGVPVLIAPIIGDQFNNATRIEETGFGYKIDLSSFKEEELSFKMNKILNDGDIISKWKKASKRIQEEERIMAVAQNVIEYIDKL